MIGFALCGSFCTVKSALEQLKLIVNSGYSVQPIVSETVYKTDTRFQSAEYTFNALQALTHSSYAPVRAILWQSLQVE